MADKSASKRHRKRRRSTSGASHLDEDADEQDGGRVVVDAAVGSDQEHDEEHEEEEEAEAGEKVVASKELTVEALDSFKKKQRRKGVVCNNAHYTLPHDYCLLYFIHTTCPLYFL